MIPKVIHYCWFGRNPKSQLAKKCIKSWKKYCKGYQIIEWNEDNFDITSNPYTKEAYESKKWAFVTDYVRLWALYNYGGVYMDTDVQVVKSLTPFLEKEKAFSGFEDAVHIPTGIMAAEKGLPIIGNLLAAYDDMRFILPDGSLNTQTNVETITNYMLTRGFVPNNSYQTIEYFSFYPKDFFCPKEYATGLCSMTENTATIHHFNGSWHTKEEKRKHNKSLSLVKRREIIHRIIHIPNRLTRKLIGRDRYEKLKSKFKK